MAVFDTPIKSNDQSIDRVLNAGLPVMLVFLDGVPNVELQTAMERAAREYAGQVLIVQIPTRDNPASAAKFGVRGLPTLVTARDGRALSQAEKPGTATFHEHLAYLLGRGPKPGIVEPPLPPASASQPGAPAGQPIHANDQSFDELVMRANQTVLVDFWAPWCGPCRMINPVLEKLSRELTGRLRIVKLNVDENPLISGRYGVQSIPTMMIVKNGKIVDRWVGALPEPAIRSRVQSNL